MGKNLVAYSNKAVVPDKPLDTPCTKDHLEVLTPVVVQDTGQDATIVGLRSRDVSPCLTLQRCCCGSVTPPWGEKGSNPQKGST